MALSLSLLVLCAFGILEMACLYMNQEGNTGNFLRTGVLVFIIVQAWLAVKKAISIVKLSTMASIDALTGCRNRTAYIHHLEELQGRQDIVAVIADLNNLKTINDTLGHEVGDDATMRWCGVPVALRRLSPILAIAIALEVMSSFSSDVVQIWRN